MFFFEIELPILLICEALLRVSILGVEIARSELAGYEWLHARCKCSIGESECCADRQRDYDCVLALESSRELFHCEGILDLDDGDVRRKRGR
jgi:hypothetical protein